ncbi:MAG TPA: hypothetical protein VHC97_16065 [Thermoanaerobaculia bacterium]|jgi:hypothetical protein|nr:hypothetical protein [Thermoanaerobaculia bacterium]
MRTPELSVVVTLQEPPVAGGLDAVWEGAAERGIEVILVDGLGDGSAEELAKRYPGAVGLAPPAPLSLPLLQRAGIERARGRLVALTEAHCALGPGWAEAAIEVHRWTSAPVIGGAVEPGEGLGPLDWALYFCDYGQFLQPLAEGPVPELPGSNIVFKGEVLRSGRAFTAGGFWKTFFCRSCKVRGEPLWAAPRLVAFYHRRLRLGPALRRRYLHGRCYGAMAVRPERAARRISHALAGPLLPGLLTTRLVRRVWRKGRFRARLLATLPLCALLLAAWSAGEWIGNLRGDGGACQRL